jgi:hypothetical protein
MMVRFASSLLISFLLAALLLAQETAAQPKVVTLTGQIIEASNPQTPSAPDPTIPSALLGELKKTFQFTQYKSLGTVTGSTPVGKTWSTPLATTGLTLEATPKAVDGGITVEVRLLRGGSAVVTSTLKLALGGQVLVGGPTIPGGRLILALTGK